MPAAIASEFSHPCPGCEGRRVALCAPTNPASRAAPQRRECIVCHGTGMVFRHADFARRDGFDRRERDNNDPQEAA